MLEAETLADAAGGSAVQVGYPSRAQSRVLSPVAPACVAQDDVEPLLLAHLRAQAGARVELGSEVTGVWAGADGARVALRDVRTGAMRAVHARYVVAADGAHSRVRAAVGVALRGADGRHGRLLDADPRAALGRRRAASPPALLDDAPRCPGRLPAHRRLGPVAGRVPGRGRAGARRGPDRGARPRGRGRARPAGADRALALLLRRGPARVALPLAARCSSPATPRTA